MRAPIVTSIVAGFALTYAASWLLVPIPPHEDPDWIAQSAVQWGMPHERGRLAFVGDSALPNADAIVLGDSRAAEDVRVRIVFPSARRPFVLAGIGLCGQLEHLFAALDHAAPRPGPLLIALSVQLLTDRQACRSDEASNPYKIETDAPPRLLRRFERVPLRGVRSWFRPATGEVATYAAEQRPRFSDKAYRNLIYQRATLEKNLARFVPTMAALKARGFDLRTVRLPIEPGLRALEDRGLPPKAIADALHEASIPYIDLGTTDATYDGSHLAFTAAERLSRALAIWWADADEDFNTRYGSYRQWQLAIQTHTSTRPTSTVDCSPICRTRCTASSRTWSEWGAPGTSRW